MSTLSPLRFSGVSSFSEDFQAILDRATRIAALPVTQLQNQQTALVTKKQVLSDIGSKLSALTSSVEKLGQTGRVRALSVSSSNTSRVTVLNNGVTSGGSHTITDITSVARSAAETTVSGFATADATAVDTDTSLELVLGDETFSLDLSAHGGNNLNALAEAINESGAAVTATVLDTGSNFYLSLSATNPGATTLELRTTAGNAGSNLLTNTNQGADSAFKLNGLQVERPDNVISDLIPGLTFTLVSETEDGESISLTASSSRSSLATALGSLVSSYNSVRTALNQQIGESAGLLSGDQLIGQMNRALRELTGYRGEGEVSSLAELGIELDKTGAMSFDSTKLYSLSTSQLSAAFDFLGSETSGFGGLSDSLDAISNPFSGSIRNQQDSYDAADLRIDKQIEEINTRIERMQASMSQKLQQADALLATLQSQQNALDASIKSVNFATYGKNQ